MKRSICMSILALHLAFAGTRTELDLGESYNFAERDILELINEHIAKNKESLDKKGEILRQKGIENAKNFKPKGLEPLEPAMQDRTFYPNLEYTLENDIIGADGKIIYKKGLKFNPADYIKISYAMVVIDGTNEAEIEWFEKSGFANSIAYRLLLSNGSYYELNKRLGQNVFYLMPKIREKFKIQKTPSIIQQVGNQIEVKELCLPCKNEDTINLDENSTKANFADLNSSINSNIQARNKK